MDQFGRRGFIQHPNTVLLRYLVQAVNESLPGAPGGAYEAGVELDPAADFLRLSRPHRIESHAFRFHPCQGLPAVAHEQLGEIRIATVLGHTPHVLQKFFFGISAEVGVRNLFICEVQDFAHFVNVPESETGGAARKRAVAAALRLRRSFEHQDARARVLRGECSTHRCIAGANHNHIDCLSILQLHAFSGISLRRRACPAEAQWAS
jgi:hypothetical protein